MKVTKRIVENNATVGYLILDGEAEGTPYEFPYCNNSLYTEFCMRPLTEAGYKYYSHNADEIEDPNGVRISEYEAVDLSTIDKDAWFSSIDLSSEMLSDVEASAYYTFREESYITFKTEPTYEINTREEFIAYLESCSNMFFNVSFSMDNRPINAFVNPKALFSIQELQENPELKRYFEIIVKRHTFRNYEAYKRIVSWLMEKGVLQNPKPSISEFLSAYYAWGPEGLNDVCTNMDVKLNVDGYFLYAKDPIMNGSPEEYLHSNRIKKPVIFDADQGLHYLKLDGTMKNIMDVQDFGRNRVAILNNDTVFALRRADMRGYKYRPQNGASISDVSDRLYITLLSGNGHSYVYKVAHNGLKVGLAHDNTSASVVYSAINFAFSSIMPSIQIPFDVCETEADYALWNAALATSVRTLRSKTVTPPVGSTVEYLKKDGVTPIGIANYMAHAVNTNKGSLVNRKYEISNPDDDLHDAITTYISEIPEEVLNSFNLSSEDCPTMADFIEMADVDDLNDRRDQMDAGNLMPGDDGFDYTYAAYKSKHKNDASIMASIASALGASSANVDAVDFFTKVSFVNDIMSGRTSIDEFGKGKMDDLAAGYLVAVECMLSAVYAELGKNPDMSQAIDLLQHLTDRNILNVDAIFRQRDNAYKGYLVDFADYRERRGCADTWIWAYVTRVFREISNAPIEKQRPYLMELITLENSKPDLNYRALMEHLVTEAINKADLSDKPLVDDPDHRFYNLSERSCYLKSVSTVAARLFFYVYAGGIKNEPVNGIYNVEFNISDNRTINIEIPEEVVPVIKAFDKDSHKKYITVYDYCKYEYNPNSAKGTFTMMVVNADIDPWHVTPKKGYAIKSYSLLPNYYDQSALDGANGEGFYMQAVNDKSICVAPFKKTYKRDFIPTASSDEIYMAEADCANVADPADLASYLSTSQYEFIFAYVKRWALERKKATAMGKKLISIPLKQDIVYGAFAHLYNEEIPSITPVYSNDVTFDDKQAQKLTNVIRISGSYTGNEPVALTVADNSIAQFDVTDIDYDALMSNHKLLAGKIMTSGPVLVSGNYIIISHNGEDIKLLATRLKSNDIANLVAGGFLIKIKEGTYFIPAINGDFVLKTM